MIRATALLAALAVLALQVGDTGWLVELDNAVTNWLVGHRIPVADQVALAVTNVFGPAEIASATVLLAAVPLVRFRSYLGGLTVIVTVGGASALCVALKLSVGRGRPPIGIRETLETDYSFPSGHVTGAGALLGMFAVVLGITRSEAVKRWLTGVAAVFVTAVAASRLYLGVHWLTDVLAGALLAAAAVVVGATTLHGLLDGEAMAPVVATPRRGVRL